MARHLYRLIPNSTAAMYAGISPDAAGLSLLPVQCETLSTNRNHEPNGTDMPATATHTVTVKDLKAALTRVSPAIATRSSVQVLTCVRIGDGLLTATNIEATISVPMPACIGMEPVLASAADLKRVLSACKPADLVTLERVDGDVPALAIETPNGRVDLPGFDMDDWPPSVSEDRAYPFAFAPADPTAFARVLADVSRIASTDESRSVLMSTMLEVRGADVRICCTDSYRLAIDVEPGEAFETFAACVPSASKYLKGFASIVSVEATHASSEDSRAADTAFVRVTDAEGVTCTLRATAGRFPNVDQLVPSSWEHRVDVPAGMAAAVKFAAKMITGNQPIHLAFDADGFELSASVQDGANTSKRFEGVDHGTLEPITIGFNADYLLDGLTFVGEDGILDMIASLRPGLLRSAARDQRVYLIMPVRLPG